jgi:hypothetical protein
MGMNGMGMGGMPMGGMGTNNTGFSYQIKRGPFSLSGYSRSNGPALQSGMGMGNMNQMQNPYMQNPMLSLIPYTQPLGSAPTGPAVLDLSGIDLDAVRR